MVYSTPCTVTISYGHVIMRLSPISNAQFAGGQRGVPGRSVRGHQSVRHSRQARHHYAQGHPAGQTHPWRAGLNAHDRHLGLEKQWRQNYQPTAVAWRGELGARGGGGEAENQTPGRSCRRLVLRSIYTYR